MKRIRFRGNYLGSRSRVYGDYVHKGDKEYIFDGVMPLQCTDIVQLIGIDADGKEIYEGDYVEVVHDGKQYVYQAHLEGFATGKDGIYLTSKQLSTARRI